MIGAGMGGFGAADRVAARVALHGAAADARARLDPRISSATRSSRCRRSRFPHIGIFCLTAKRLGHFRKTVVLYPICMLAIWLPSVFLGVVANAARDVPAIAAKLEAAPSWRRRRPTRAASAIACAARRRATTSFCGWSKATRRLWLAALLGACVMAAVMASDSQILALSTMFTEDVFAFYGGTARFGEAVQVRPAGCLSCCITLVAYVIALRVPQSIFEVATQYAFAGYSALSPLLVAALFWREQHEVGRARRHGVDRDRRAGVAAIQQGIPPPPPGTAVPVWSHSADGHRHAGRRRALVLGCLPVVPMTIVSALLMVIVSRLTAAALVRARRRWRRYFDGGVHSVVRTSWSDEASLMATLERPRRALTPVQWLICVIAAIGFAFDSYELLMLPLIVRPALSELLGVPPNSPLVNEWVGILLYVPAVAGGIFGLLGGYLTDLFGRRRVLVWSILLYAFSAFAAGFSTSVGWLLFWRCCTFVGVCVEFVAAVAWLASCSRSEAARSGDRLHAGVRLDRRHHGDRRVLLDRHLRRVASGGARRTRGVALHADVWRHSGDSADRHPSVPAGVAGVAREEGRRHAQASELRASCSTPDSAGRQLSRPS